VVLAHGLQKFGLLGGRGLGGVSDTMRGLGFSPPALWAVVVGMAETGGGLLMVLGFLGPVGPGLVAADLAVAIATIYRPHGFWNQDGGYEFVACLVGAAVANALLGHGSLSFDAALGLVTTDWFAPAWLGLMAIGAAAALLSRSSRPPRSSGTPAADQADVATSAKKRGPRLGRARRP
jgi:putative oxidoreductase